MAAKLNSMRFLEKHKIPYEVFEYPDTLRDAEEVAEAIGLPYHTVYKTLVVENADDSARSKPCLVMLASECRLDLKKMAKAAGHKKVRMASHNDAESLTGLKVGGISALALTAKNWPVFLDQPAAKLQHIVISGGQRGTQLRVPIAALIKVLQARLADVGIDCDRN